jgi:hypothetical protein
VRRLAYLTIIVLFATTLGACAQATPQASDKMINPGDKIGDFLITTGGNEGITYVSMIHCPFDQSTGIESCELTVGTKVNVGVGFYDDLSSGKSLDEIWSEHTDEMVIEGRPVNLQAFGSIDITHPLVGKIRNWNVVIVTDKPGKIAARSTGVVGGDPFDYTAMLTFKAP